VIQQSVLCSQLIRAALALTLVPWVSPAEAQDYFDIVDVPVVGVDVVVTDRRGRPVTDLDREDFRLLVDGQEQAITFFSAPIVVPTTGGHDREPAYLVVLFDNNGVEGQERNAVIEELRQFFKRDLESDLQVMVATTGLSGLQIHQELTGDPELVDSALTTVAKTATRDRQVADYESLMLEIQRLSGVRDPTLRQLRTRAMTLVGQIQAFSDQARQDAEITGGHLWQLIEALTGLPGRKAILLIGGAMSISPGEALFSALREALTSTADVGAHQVAADLPAGISTGAGQAVRALAQAASVHQVRLFSIVLGGASRLAPTGGSAGSMTTGDSSATDRSDSWAPSSGFQSRQEVETALAELADETGGYVHSSGRNLGTALERLDGELAGSYSLAFDPPDGTEGATHRIDLEVGGRKLRVRHRRAFQVRSWDQEAAMRVRSGLHLGVTENPLSIGVEVQPATAVGKDTVRIPVTVEFPLSSIALEPLEDSQRGQLSVFLVPGGRRFSAEPVRKSVLPIVLSNDDLQGSAGRWAEYRLDLEAPVGTTRVAVGVRDDLGTLMSVMWVDLPTEEVARAAPEGRRMAPRSRQSGALLDLPTAALLLSRQSGGAIGLTLEAGLEPGSEGRWSLPVNVEIVESGGTASGSLDLFAFAVTGEGRVVAKSSLVVDRALRSSVEVPLELPAGIYTVRVAVRERLGSAFGVTGLEVEIPGAGVGLAHWSSREEEPGRIEPPTLEPQSPDLAVNFDSSRQSIRDGYRRALEALMAEDAAAARQAVRTMESAAIEAGDREALLELAKAESRVLIDLAEGEWNRLLPIAVIYGQLIAEYRSLRQEPLSEHAMLLSTQLAERMARKTRGPRERAETSDLLVSLSGYLLYLQRLAKTEDLLGLALKENPRNPWALIGMVAVLEQRGDYLGAVETAEKLLEVDPDNAEGHLRLGVNLARTKRPEEGIESFRALMDLESADWIQQVAVQEMARALVSQGRTGEAIEVLGRAAERWPEQPSMRIQLAWVLDLCREPDQAEGWIAGLAVDAADATDSSRYRYLQWYEEGLEELRASLMAVAAERAEGLNRGIGSAGATEGLR
jgi:VWFA-related protein